MEILGIKQDDFIVPVYNMKVMKLNKIFLTHILDILLVHTYCLSRSCYTEDATELLLVIKELDPWMKDLDGDDMKRRRLLVKNLMETSISYHDDGLAAERIAVTLLEHNKVCKLDARMQEPMTFIAEARAEREKGGVLGLNNCLAKLDKAINLLEHDENDHRLLEEIISLKGGSREEPERMVSNIASKITKSSKSSCRVAQFYYDQGERMLLMGKMTKALNHAREGRNRRYDLLKENFDLTLRDAKLYSFHMACCGGSCMEFLSVEVLLREHLNAKPCGKGRENSKYRCRCWDCICLFSLLSVLNEKGKDYVLNDETRKARDIFLKNMRFVVSLSSLPSSESPRTLCELFELVMRSDGDFLTSNETLIATLKHVLILSSETPELHKKIAQLLAIMYLSGFSHKLTVNLGVNYLFSRRLSKVYGDDCDPNHKLHRLTTSSDVDLNEFVSKFYSQIQPHTILVINILGDKYKKLLGKQPFYVPSEDAAFFMISRFSSTREPPVDVVHALS
ncbi:hypothetical protein Tco_0607793 [Tanacetum coccineum]